MEIYEAFETYDEAIKFKRIQLQRWPEIAYGTKFEPVRYNKYTRRYEVRGYRSESAD